MINRRQVLQFFQFSSLGLLLSNLRLPFSNSQRSQALVPQASPNPGQTSPQSLSPQSLLKTLKETSIGTPTPGYNTHIPAKILTPDEVPTRLGTLRFFDGMPDDDTVQLCFDNLDLMRGVETFLNGIPATSIEGIRLGLIEAGAATSHHCLVFDQLMDSNPLFLTGNTDTVYGMVMLNLQEDGPTVVEIPPNCGPSTVNDAFFRFVTDMGIPGPDGGQGAKYLVLPPDYEGDLNPPEGGMEAEVNGETFFVSQSKSYVNWLIIRNFLVDGKTDVAVATFQDGVRVYPLSQADNPPTMEFVTGSKVPFNTIHANNFEFYEELHTVIEREPISMLEPELRGIFAAIGIQKGKPFDPDERLREILTQAVAVGNATARSIWLKSRLEGSFLYENSGWFTAFVGGSYEWLKDGGNGGRWQDARTLFFYMATVNTPAMVDKIVGKGSQYTLNATDTDGNYLEGSKNYKLNIPANVPAKDFWSVVVYDPQTRSQLQTSQPFPSKNSEKAELLNNADGSVDLYFGPQAPTGKEENWIETVPGKGWFCILRLYGPLEPWFEKTWRPGEIELVG